MLTTLCALLVFRAETPKDVNQLMEFIRSDYARQKGYSDEWKFTGQFDGHTVSYSRTLDNPRQRFEMTMDGSPVLLFGTDGKTEFTILFPAKTYYQEPPAKPDPKNDKPVEAEDQTFKFAFDSSGMELLSKPEMKIISLKSETADGVKVRHLVAQAVNPTTGGRLQADVLFWPDAWIPTDVTVHVFHKDKPTDLIVHAVATIKKEQTFAPSIFSLDPSLVKDFVKVTRDEMIKSIGGG
ncbi:MAG TPA: hypothetical protein VHE55_09565 [Fimbriimonadaceae bacterium]|nr:hypothetical protein [Fimbriimonadaceae bacterium]